MSMIKKVYEAALLFVGTLGWWGFVYPELCPDGQVYEEEALPEEKEDEIPEEMRFPGQRALQEKGSALTESPKASSVPAQSETTADLAKRAESEEKGEAALPETEDPGWELGEIRIKSRLMEYVCEMKENRQRKRE